MWDVKGSFGLRMVCTAVPPYVRSVASMCAGCIPVLVTYTRTPVCRFLYMYIQVAL